MSVIDSIHKYMATESDIIKRLMDIKDKEPYTDDARTLIMRGCICGYELGAIQQAIMRNSAEHLDPVVKAGHMANAKLGMADLIVQLRMICITLNWSFKDIQDMGINHLKERHAELDKDGWSD